MNMQVVLYLLFLVQIYQTESSPFPKLLQTVTLEEVVPLQPQFYPERLMAQWVSDDEYLYRDPGYGIRKYNALTDDFVTFLNEEELYILNNQSIASYSHDGKYLLLSSNKKKVYRYSSLAEYSVYDLQKRNIVKLAPGTLQAVVWGGKNDVAYVQHNNVYYVPDVSKPNEVQALTAKGTTGKVYFGVTDWIYEEEVFNAAEALWFSPDSTYLAVASFNDTKVDSAVFPVYGNPADLNNQYPKMIQFKYPKAGRPNPVVGLRVFTLNEPLREPWHILPPVHLIGTDYILGRVNWATDYNLVVLWLNRRQNRSILINCDLKNISCNILRDREEPRGWIDIYEPIFDSTGTKMVEIQPLSHGGKWFLHAGRFDYSSLTIEDLSPGNLTVTEISGWNLNTDTVYFIIASTAQPWLRQLWATSGGVVKCISCKEPSCHSVNTAFSKEAKFAIISCSSSSAPHKTFLYNSHDDSLRLLKDSTRLIEKLSQYKQPMYLFNIIDIGDNVKAHIKLVLPSEININEKYPMIVRVYAGPGTARVKDNFDMEYYNMYLSTNRSFIVASIDVRGSGVMGIEEMFAVNNALGTVEVEDTLAAIRRLVELYSFIDPQRIGVFGWSYGGYVTTMMLIKDNQNIVTCGAAIAPVTSWLYYDTIYTERYMDVPGANVLGYINSDIIAKAEKLRGRRFLLVHGTGDDNVHIQHSMQLAKQLQHADIHFEQMSYVDENHSLLGVSRHLYHTLDRFWTKCFFSKST